MKVCEEKFPEGTYKGQQGDGFYMEGFLKPNLDMLVRNITKDMQFVGLVTGNGTVRNGKSTMAMQMGYYYSYEISKKLKKEIPFDIRNVVFKAKDLIDTAHRLPQYSCLILDEGDDLTAHYFSKLAQDLKRFFRKCGQLNLFIILILPDFFELPKHYAIVRSNFLVNVKFMGEFDRGYYDFYGPKNKRWLYILGRKESNYQPKGVSPDFDGRFVPLYTVNEESYRKKKKRDLEEDKDSDKSMKEVLREERVRIFGTIIENLPDMTIKKLGQGFGIAERTANRYMASYKLLKRGLLDNDGLEETELIGITTDGDGNQPREVQDG